MASRLAVIVVLLLAFLPAGVLAQTDEPERLRIHGSNVLGAHLVPALVDSWLKDIGYERVEHRRISIHRSEITAVRDGMALLVEIDKRGTAAGMAALAAGEAEIAMSARQPNASETDAAWQLGNLTSPEQEWVLGLDGLAVLVAQGNRVSELSLEQLQGVLSGRISNWRQLGGDAGPIRVHTMRADTGTGELAASLLSQGSSPARGTRGHASHAALVAAVAGDPAAIGVAALRSGRGRTKALAIRGGALPVAPERLQVSSEDYPLQRRVYFHTGQLITALGRSFAQYAVSPAGQAVVERSQFLSLNLRPMAPGELQDAPEEYRQLVASARRLPMTIRFGTGLDLLDSRSRQDVERLAGFLRRPENAKRRVMLVGFANPEPKSPYQSLSFSQERVDYVCSELLSLNMKVVTVRGFGGSRSLVDARNPSARYRNNRVEVWLR